MIPDHPLCIERPKREHPAEESRRGEGGRKRGAHASGQAARRCATPPSHHDHHPRPARADGADVVQLVRVAPARAHALPGLVPRRASLALHTYPPADLRAALSLCRRRSHQAPEIIRIYGLNVNPQYIRRAIRAKFEEHRHVSDPRTVDVLLHKGQQEFQETMNQWKMPDQLLGLLLQPKQRAPRTFMQKFLEGASPARVPACLHAS
jgi:NADH dehydrogenase (ubiquinone) 1 alpha subcomplex subunit 6